MGPAMMALRLVLLGIVVYLGADFASPHLAGAVTFEINDCVDGVRTERPRAGAAGFTITPFFTRHAFDRPAARHGARPRGRPAGRIVPDVRRARDGSQLAADRALSADDH
jgi:hypothetical protein